MFHWIYPCVRDFIVYFGGHLHVIKTSYTGYVKNILTLYEECSCTHDREVYLNVVELNFDSLEELLASNSSALGSVLITSDYDELISYQAGKMF